MNKISGEQDQSPGIAENQVRGRSTPGSSQGWDSRSGVGVGPRPAQGGARGWSGVEVGCGQSQTDSSPSSA